MFHAVGNKEVVLCLFLKCQGFFFCLEGFVRLFGEIQNGPEAVVPFVIDFRFPFLPEVPLCVFPFLLLRLLPDK